MITANSSKTCIYKGEDKKIVLKLKDKSGAPIIIDNGENIKVLLTVNDTEVAKFSKEEEDGFEDINTGSNPGEYYILIKRENSSSFPSGLMRMEILIKRENSDFPEGYHSSGKTPLGKVVEHKLA
jgi:hypothetical protein